jgi:hypothetical protein
MLTLLAGPFTARSGYAVPLRFLARWNVIVRGWVLAASGVWVGEVNGVTVGLGGVVGLVGVPGLCALFWMLCAAERIEGSFAYRYRPGQAVCPASR